MDNHIQSSLSDVPGPEPAIKTEYKGVLLLCCRELTN